MSVVDQINGDIKAAMLAREKEKLAALRSIKSALMMEATKGGDTDVTDEVATKIIQKLHKQRKDAAAIYKEQGREDLFAEETAEAGFLEAYLPEQMGEEELRAVVKGIVEKLGASSMADMGKVMGAASGQLAGKADGKAISNIVKELLGS
jgi:uncharacterized protein YqeY